MLEQHRMWVYAKRLSAKYYSFFEWHINFRDLFNAKYILVEWQLCNYLINIWEDTEIPYHSQGYLSEIERKSASYFAASVEYFSYYPTE